MSAPGAPPASRPEERTDEHFRERHAAFLKRIAEGPIDLLFLGDSIMRRWAEVPGLWEAHYGRRGAVNFGVGSDTTQGLLWRLLNGEADGVSPRVAVLLIGTNNMPTHSAAEIVEAIREIVRVLGEKMPRAQILLLAILPRRDFMEKVRAVNAGLSSLDDGHRVRTLDIGPFFLDPGGEVDPALMPDGLHLVEPGYVIWARRMEPLLSEMLARPT